MTEGFAKNLELIPEERQQLEEIEGQEKIWKSHAENAPSNMQAHVRLQFHRIQRQFEMKRKTILVNARQRVVHKLWEERLKQSVWSLREAAGWISSQVDVQEALYQKGLKAISEGKLSYTKDSENNDYFISPVQILLIFAPEQNFTFHWACRNFLDQTIRDERLKQLVRKKANAIKSSHEKIKRKDIRAIEEFKKVVQMENEYNPAATARELLERNNVENARQKHLPQLTEKSIERHIRNVMPHETKKCGRPKK